ncbi:MAG: hypothetical protein LUH52_04520 [Bacteroides uniformis]|nr:hypothetical protein [Bacteroides uniformis]
MGVDHTKIRTALYCAKGWLLDREDSTPMISYQYLLDKNTNWINTGVYGESQCDYWNVEMPPELCHLCEAAKSGQVDLIITPSITHFHKDSATALKIAGELADMPNPVEVFFQTENIFSLKDTKSIEVLTECLMMAT